MCVLFGECEIRNMTCTTVILLVEMFTLSSGFLSNPTLTEKDCFIRFQDYLRCVEEKFDEDVPCPTFPFMYCDSCIDSYAFYQRCRCSVNLRKRHAEECTELCMNTEICLIHNSRSVDRCGQFTRPYQKCLSNVTQWLK